MGVMMKTQYKVGDTVVINNKDWVVRDIRMRYGKEWVYGLTYENANGADDSFIIETVSLETILK